MNRIILTSILAISFATVATAQQEDPFRDAFFPPEIAVHHAEKLGISDAEKQEIHQLLESQKAAYEEAHKDRETAAKALAEALEAHPSSKEEVLGKFDALLAAENAMKRLHVEAMVAVRNSLTKEQIAKINDLKKGPEFSPDQQKIVQETIEPRLKKFQELMHGRQQAQNPPPQEIGQVMDNFHKAMHEKKLDAALKLIDEAIALVE
ncbi:MAG: Spy/CpxP family protein refolding chaperone [Verrucomicrobiota bacterium]